MLDRRDAVRALMMAGDASGEIARKLAAKFGCSERAIHRDMATVREDLRAEGQEYRQVVRQICAKGFLDIYRAAMGLDLDDVPDEAFGITDVEDPEHAVMVMQKRYPQLRKRDLMAAVAAMRELGKLHGAYEPERVEHEVSGGVLVAPAQISVAEWARSAAAGALGPAQDSEDSEDWDW